MALTQSYLLGRIVSNAKRYKKNQFYIRERRTYSIRRTGAFSTVLQIAWAEKISATQYKMAIYWAQLSSRRPFFGSYLCGSSRFGQNRKRQIAFLQWTDSRNTWASQLSASFYSARFSSELRAKKLCWTYPVARPIQKRNAEQAESFEQRDYRHGCYGNYRLWQTRRDSRWLQSNASRQTQLLPFVCKRREKWLEFGNRIAQWVCSSCDRRYYASEIGFGKTSQDCGDYQNSFQSRCELLRQEDYSVSRREPHWLRYCSQKYVCPDESNFGGSFSSALEEGRHWRILLSSARMGKTCSIHCDTQNCSSRRNDSGQSVSNRRVFLPGSGYQLADRTIGCLEILLAKSQPRTSDSRNQKQLFYGKNPHKIPYGQQSLLGALALGIRFGLYIQTSLPSASLPKLDIAYVTTRIVDSSRTISQNRKSLLPELSKTLLKSRTIPICLQTNKSNSFDFVKMQITPLYISSQYVKKRATLPFFQVIRFFVIPRCQNLSAATRDSSE